MRPSPGQLRAAGQFGPVNCRGARYANPVLAGLGVVSSAATGNVRPVRLMADVAVAASFARNERRSLCAA